MYALWQLYTVVAIDAEYVFYHVTVAIDIYTVIRNLDLYAFFILFDDVHIKQTEDLLHFLDRNVDAAEGVDALVGKIDNGILCLDWINLYWVANDGASCKFLDEECCTTQCVWDIVDIDTTLIAERGIGRKLLTTCSLAHPSRVEASALKEDVLCLFCSARLKSTEHTCDAHRLLGVAYHEVTLRELVFIAVESNERSALGTSLDNDLAALDLVCIESMHRHASLVEYEVGDINDIVDWAHACCLQTHLQPFWRLLDSYAFDGDARVSRTSLCVINLNLDLCDACSLLLVFGKHLVEFADTWLGELMWQVVSAKIGIEVASHTEV